MVTVGVNVLPLFWLWKIYEFLHMNKKYILIVFDWLVNKRLTKGNGVKIN